METNNTLLLTAEIISGYLSKNHAKPEELPELIRIIRATLSESDQPSETDAPAASPKADKRAIAKSITPDALVSFLDGKPYKTLKRHLTRHGHDLKSYKAAFGLPSDYPSVAANYSAQRSAMAKQLGLGARGRSPKAVASQAAPPKASATKKSAAKKAAGAK